MCHSEPPTGVRNPYRDALQRIAVGISRRFAPRNDKLLCKIHAYPEFRLDYNWSYLPEIQISFPCVYIY
jgi:hypothetical protein